MRGTINEEHARICFVNGWQMYRLLQAAKMEDLATIWPATRP